MMASREELLQSIQPGMSLTKNCFLRIYGYSVTDMEFADQALSALEVAGCSKAREYYDTIISEYEARQAESIKPVAAEYVRKLNEEFEKKVGEEQRIQKRMLEILQSK